MSRSANKRLRFDALEVRDVPTTATFYNGVLDIRGSGTHDTITVTEDNGRFVVTGIKVNANGKLFPSVGIAAVNGVYIDAGPGHDFVDASKITTKSVIIIGGTGNDTILGGTKGDFIYARDGNDSIDGGAGNDLLFGENGDDTVNGGDGKDLIYGGNGNDVLSGGVGNDILRGEYGDDELNGDDGDDRLEGGDGMDSLNGGVGNDVAYGQAGDDVINGGTGNDRLYGQTDSDLIHGNEGDDTIAGGDGGDLLFGDAGADVVFAGEVSDILDGGDGNDTLVGGGNDILVGGENTGNNNNNNNNNNNPQPPANSQAVVTNVRAQWVDGLTAEVVVSNISPVKVTNWTIEFDAKFNITNVWNAQIVGTPTALPGGGWHYTIGNIPNFFNSTINPNSQVTFGYNAQFPANTSLAITNYELNNVAV